MKATVLCAQLQAHSIGDLGHKFQKLSREMTEAERS